MRFPLRVWIALCATLSCAGWGLSWAKALGPGAYAVVLGFFTVAVVFHVKRGWVERARRTAKQSRRRFRRPVAFIYLLTAVMALASGLFCTTANWDAMSYRVPRVLHWLHEGGWHWIRTEDVRLNVVAPGVEWLYAPLLEFTHTDHYLFLINWVSFLFLPGLIFSVFRAMGVKGRVAWWWMWILPCASCYALQASSLANDAYAVVYALAALDFAFRAGRSGRVADVWCSALAAALLTGVKQSNLPLLLPWAVAIWPSLRLVLPRLWSSALVGVAALMSSAGPISRLNAIHTGTWKGFAPGRDLDPGSPVFALAGNAFTVGVQNLLPPIFPLAGRWNAWMESFVRTPFGSHFAKFDHFGYLAPSTSEINAGLGPALVLLLACSVWGAWRTARGSGAEKAGAASWWLTALRICPWVSAAVFAAKVSSFEMGRYFSVYYPLMLPLPLAWAGQEKLVRLRWWRRLALASGVFTLVCLATSRQRPPWPAAAVFSWFNDYKGEGSGALTRLQEGFGFSAYHREQIGRLLEKVPEGEAVLGYAAQASDQEVDLWQPWGRRRAVRVSFHDARSELIRQGVRYVMVDHTALKRDKAVFIEPGAYPGEKDPPIGIEVWARHLDAEVVREISVRLGRTGPPVHWYLLRLRD